MPNFSIPIFANVNDNPIPPSPVNQANADYLISKFNALVEDLYVSTANNFSNLVTADRVFYLDSISGSDNNDGSTAASAFQSTFGLLKYINANNIIFDNGLTIELKLSGIFDADSLDLNVVPFVNGSYSSTLLLNSKSNQTNFTLQLDSTKLNLNRSAKTEIRRCDLLIRGPITYTEDLNNKLAPLLFNNCKFFFLTNTSQFIATTGAKLRLENSRIISSAFSQTLITLKNGSILDLENSTNSYETSADNGFIFELENGSEGYFEEAVFDASSSAVSKESLIAVGHGAVVYYSNEADFRTQFSPIFAESSTFLNKRTADEQEIAIEVAKHLNDLTGANRIKLSSVAGSEDILPLTAVDIRNKLLELSGDQRLSAFAIRDINYLQYCSSTTESFVQPEVGLTVQIKIGETNWLQASQHVFVQGGGTYQITSVLDSQTVLLKNTGEFSNSQSGQTINANAKITISGRPGYRGFTLTTSIFQQPVVGGLVSIQFADDSAFYVGSVVYVENADYYGIYAINRETHVIDCVRLGYVTTIPTGTNIAQNSRVVLAGLKGDKGDYPTASLSENFIMPEIGQETIITLNDNSFINLGVNVNIEQVGTFKAVGFEASSTKLVIKNLGASNSLAPGTTAFAPKQIIVVGDSGHNAYSKVWEESVVSAVGSNFGIFCDNVDWCFIGQKVRINNYGTFEVANIIRTANALTLLNYDEEQTVGQIVSVGDSIYALGSPGAKGDPGENATYLRQTQLNTVVDVPSAGNSFELEVESVSIFVRDLYVSIDSITGEALVLDIDDVERKLYLINISIDENSQIDTSLGLKVVSVGSPSLDKILCESFIQPEIDFTVVVSTLQSTQNFIIGRYCYIAESGYYLVMGKTAKSLTLKNTYHFSNAEPSAVTQSSICRVEMLRDLPEHKVFKLSEQFSQPLKDFIVIAKFYNHRFMNVGEILRSPNNGYYEVSAINTATAEVYLKNLGYGLSDEKELGELIEENSLFYAVPPRGETTYNGNYTYLIEDFIVPEEGAEVVIEVQNSEWIEPKMFIYIESAGASYEVVSKLSENLLRVKNKNKKANTTPSNTTILSGSFISTGTFSLEPKFERHLQNIIMSSNLKLSQGYQ